MISNNTDIKTFMNELNNKLDLGIKDVPQIVKGDVDASNTSIIVTDAEDSGDVVLFDKLNDYIKNKINYSEAVQLRNPEKIIFEETIEYSDGDISSNNYKNKTLTYSKSKENIAISPELSPETMCELVFRGYGYANGTILVKYQFFYKDDSNEEKILHSGEVSETFENASLESWYVHVPFSVLIDPSVKEYGYRLDVSVNFGTWTNTNSSNKFRIYEFVRQNYGIYPVPTINNTPRDE